MDEDEYYGRRCVLCGRRAAGTADRSQDGDDEPSDGDNGEPPDDGNDGRFCSTGCRNVFETLGEPDVTTSDGPVNTPNRPEMATEASASDDLVSTYLRVDGMHRRTCETFLEGTAENRDGVVDAEASYITETIRVDHAPERCSPSVLQDALSTVGYTAYLRADADGVGGERDGGGGHAVGPSRRSREVTGTRKRRFEDMLDARYILGIVFGTFLLVPYVTLLYPVYLSSFYDGGVLGLYADAFDEGVDVLFLRFYFVLTGIVLYFTGLPVLRGAYVALKTRRPNADVLVSVTIVAAFVYSTIAALTGGIRLYYDLTLVVAAAVMTATYYEATVKRRGMDLLTELTISQVDTARRYAEDGTTQEVATDELESGDQVLVRSGERVPIDGTLADGECTVDEAVVTGESLPVTRRVGDPIVGGSIVTSNAAAVAVDDCPTSTVERLTQTVWGLQSADHGIQRRADRHAGFALLAVVTAALLAAGTALVLNTGPTESALVTLLVVLVACPWALGLATPLSTASSLEEAIERGFVVFDDTVFERLRGIDVVVFDKTGTLTTGEMRVLDATAPPDVLAAVAALERRASHPVASAIVDAFGETGDDPTVADFTTHATGVEGTVDGTAVLAGTPDFVASKEWAIPAEVETQVAEARRVGRLPVVTGRDGIAEGVIVVGDEQRDGWERTITALHERGMDVVVLTGDDTSAAKALERHPHVDDVFANVPPAGKTEAVRRLRSRGRVAMVGDGTNDAPALAAADLGISFGGGTDLAADAADLSLLEDDLDAVETAFDLAAAARTRVRQNTALALVYNAIVIPAALLGMLNPLSAMLAVVASILLLVGNSSRDLVDA